MAPFQHTKTQRNPHAGICKEGDADTILGLPKAHLSKGMTVTSASYCHLLRKHLKQPSDQNVTDSSVPVVFFYLHDNSTPHTACLKAEMIRDIHFERLPHLPFSPNFVPCDCRMFGSLKEALGGKIFLADEELQEQVHEWLFIQPEVCFFFHEESRH
jgi:hypothetical protein